MRESRRGSPAQTVMLVVVFLSLALVTAHDWESRVQEGIALHHRYLHRKAKETIVQAAAQAPHHQRQIAVWLMEEAQKLMDEAKDEVGARGMLESSMAVARMLMDPETMYSVANLFLAAGAPPQALEGYTMVQTLLPTLASTYHQIGLTLSRMNKLDEAYEAYIGAIQLLPTYAITYNNIGMSTGQQTRGRIFFALHVCFHEGWCTVAERNVVVVDRREVLIDWKV